MKKSNIPIKEAKKLIIESLTAFDEDLGTRVKRILNSEKRLNIAEVTEGQARMMQYRPPGITLDDVIAAEMHIPDFAERFSPQFTRQDNPEDYGIVDFEYDGTPKSIVWLGHELGHAIADDIQRDNGRSNKDYSPAEMEEQAYFVQHIVSKSVHEKFGDLAPESLGEDVLKMSFDRATQFTNAGNAYENTASADTSQRTSLIHSALDQRSLA